MKRKIRLNKLHNLYDLVYNSAVCENNLITPTELHRGEVDGPQMHINFIHFLHFVQGKKCASKSEY